MLIFLLPTLVRGYEKRTKGTRESPLFAEVYGTLLARVGEELNKCNYARCRVCVCVCVSKISKPAKFKPLKDTEPSASLRITL